MRITGQIILFLGLCGSMVLPAGPQNDSPEKAATSERSRETSGRRVFRDPVTGLMRPPEASELAPSFGAAQRRVPSVVMRQLPNGGLARRTPLDEMDFLMVTRGADGSLSYSCARKPEKGKTAGKEQALDR